MTSIAFPTSADELTLDMLNVIVREQHPGVRLTGFDVVQAKAYGEQMVSTAGRST